MGVIYFLVCVRKHESSLPTIMQQDSAFDFSFFIDIKCDKQIIRGS